MQPKSALLAVALVVVLLLASYTPASAISLEDALLAFGIGYAVRVFGDQINSGLNTLLAQQGLQFEGTTKVVPILSVGSGAYIGAAQVAGPPSLVNQVRAVAQGQTSIGDLRASYLIPVSDINVLRGINRVDGVGLSALVDFRL
ncbi:MAG TPA: hypothetical protein PLU88_08470 [Armatimonadota bacterium]|jgi:hypothetical protein|nr:hypothetical protein [Armatimonadota bacterium]HPP75142.1 hypothetical protein [Armatimonadota bacterium]